VTPAVAHGCLRQEIVQSWHASIAAGLRPGWFAPPRDRGEPSGGDVLGAAAVVADRLADDLADTDVSVVVADAGARIIARRAPGGRELRWLDDRCLAPGYVWGVATAGTNALVLAIEHCSPTLVIGDEHFADRLLDLSMAAAPIRDPHSGAVAGALALACPAAGSSSLLLHVARRSAQDVEAQVHEDRRPEPRRSLSSDEFRRRGRSDASLGWDSLTECEWRLAELVADGLTNRQAAARLSVSHHTVDSHLRHIFRKLDINSRVGLARVMSSRGGAVDAVA
jgi:transcriptional regulator of acetoin/glycerol metabolism